MVGSRTATPNVLLEVATGGLGVIAPEQVRAGIPSVPILLTQQFTEGNYGIPQQQLIFSPEPLATAEGASADYATICPANATATSPANAAA